MIRTTIKKTLLLLFISTCFSAGANETLIVSVDNQPSTSFGENAIGQAFTAPVSGEMTAVSIRTLTTFAPSVTLDIYAGAGVSGTLLHSQGGIQLTSLGQNAAQQIITLDTPLPITEGNVYTFMFGAISGIILYSNQADVYPGGDIFYLYSGSYLTAAADLDFGIYATQSAPPPPVLEPRAIPSLSLSGLITLLAVFAVILHFSRKKS